MLKTSDMLNRLITTRGLIDEPDKWTQRRLLHDYNRRCFVGALWGNYISGQQDIMTAQWIVDTIKRLFPNVVPRNVMEFDNVDAICYFNDHPTTTHADIMRLIDELIATAE